MTGNVNEDFYLFRSICCWKEDPKTKAYRENTDYDEEIQHSLYIDNPCVEGMSREVLKSKVNPYIYVQALHWYDHLKDYAIENTGTATIAIARDLTCAIQLKNVPYFSITEQEQELFHIVTEYLDYYSVQSEGETSLQMLFILDVCLESQRHLLRSIE